MKLKKTSTKSPATEAEKSCLVMESPVGELLLVASGSALEGIYFSGRDHVPASSKSWKLDDRHRVLVETAKQLREYFNGKRKRFSVPIHFIGTEFQEKIWRQITLVPHGATVSYSELAERAGSSNAVRATGTSTGRNPIAIIVPCHRVVGKNGHMCGFAGGLDKKLILLELERQERGLR